MQWHHHAIKTLVFTQMAKCPKPTEIRVPNGGVSKGKIKDEKIRRQKQYLEPGGLAQTDYLCQASLLSATSHLLFAKGKIAKISRELNQTMLENAGHLITAALRVVTTALEEESGP